MFDFDAAEPAWGAEIDVTDDPRGLLFSKRTWDAVCGLALPNDRILSYWANGTDVSAFFSDDAGATWSPYALPALDAITTPERMRTVFYRGDIALFTEELDDFQQFGSNSLGTKFILVSSINNIGASVSAVAIPGNGGIAVAYSNFADDFPSVRILSSAFDPIEDATEVIIDSSVEVTDCTIAVDGNGTLWFMGRDTTGGATDDTVRVWFSLDGGASWTRIKPAASDDFNLFVTHDAGTRIINYAATFVRGWMVLAHNWVAAPGNEDDSIGTMWSSGWGSLSSSGESLDSMYERRFSMAADTGSSVIGSTGIPIELPADTIWANAGATPPTLVSPGELEFAVVASDGSVLLSPASTTAGDDLSFFFEGKITNGLGSSGSLHYGFQLRVADGAKEYLAQFKFDADNSRIRVTDVHSAATIVDISIDVSTFVQLEAGINGSTGQLIITYRRPWDTHWILANPGIDLLTDGGAAGAVNEILFGAVATSTVTGRARQWHHSEQEFVKGVVGVAGFELGLVGTAAIASGGNVNTLPVAVPEIGTATNAAFIAAQRGPGRDEDLFTIEPFFDFGVDRIFPSISPSPSDPWRSDDLTEQVITWDFGKDTRAGQIWLLIAALINSNIKTAEIEASTGSVIVGIATYNAAEGFEGLGYTLTGDTIRPNTGSIDADRFLDRNVLRDGRHSLGSPQPLDAVHESLGLGDARHAEQLRRC